MSWSFKRAVKDLKQDKRSRKGRNKRRDPTRGFQTSLVKDKEKPRWDVGKSVKAYSEAAKDESEEL